jgi:hypothetical protein
MVNGSFSRSSDATCLKGGAGNPAGIHQEPEMTLRTSLTVLALSVALIGTSAAGAFASPVIRGPVLVPIGHGPVLPAGPGLHRGPLPPISIGYVGGGDWWWWWWHHHHHHHHHHRWQPLIR